MQLHLLSTLTFFVVGSQAAETTLGVYIFSRHGDRTAKSTPPVKLTTLGYRQVFESGTYFRDRYVSSSASRSILGLNNNVVKLSQIAASAPVDDVLMNAAQAFLQGIYPPVGQELGQETLRNDTDVQAPLNGYQLIPIQTVTSGRGSEETAWLQGASDCANAIVSSNSYFASAEYKGMLDSTTDFYNELAPSVDATFGPSEISFKNAYGVYDLLNVAYIHNQTIPSSELLTDNTLAKLRTLADAHEYGLAYNASEPIRAIAGATLAAEILQALNDSIVNPTKAPKLNIQFGAYASFLSFFGLAKLPDANRDFMGVPDYASTMTFELFTTAAPEPFPSVENLQVRFLFHNGTASNGSEPVAHPLFGGQRTEISWNDFVEGMNMFSIGSQKDWCQTCGNQTGVCASVQVASRTAPGSSDGGGISRVVAGVIGAMVTLAVVLGVEALVVLLAGLRLVRKRGSAAASNGNGDTVKA